MYERSAIVLERYLENVLNLNKKHNLRENCKNYADLMEEIENYQSITERELKIIKEFDEVAREIQSIQKKQEKLSQTNQKLEEERIKIFSELEENSTILESKLEKIEGSINTNNEELKNLKTDFVKYLSEFTDRQKERNKCEKEKRIGEAKHIEIVKKMREDFKALDQKDILNLKDFINSDKESIKEEIKELMLKNGKNEKVKFDDEAIKKAIRVRMSIAEKEAECYIIIYDRMRRILAEIENENIKLDKYKKSQKNITTKLDFLNAEKEYIAAFLDYERMTAISGEKAHKKAMEEACNNFELDIIQIDNLYELVLLETLNKATKKAYKELYNKTYLKSIEDKEKNFEQEANNIKTNVGTLINSNYWRIEGIKNIYNVFHDEIETKFGRDLSEYKIEEEPEVESKMEIEEYEENEIYIDEYEDDEEEEDEDEHYAFDAYEEEEEEDDTDEDNYELDEYDEYDEEDEEDEEDEPEEEIYEFDDDDENIEENFYEDEEDDDEYIEEDEDEIEDEDEADYIFERKKPQQKNKENAKAKRKKQPTKKHIQEDDKKDNNIFNKIFKDRKNKKNSYM